MDLGLASLRAQTRAAVSGIAELGRKDVERSLSCTLTRTSQLWPHWTLEGSPEFAKAADACGTLEEVKKSYTELFRGLCTERGKGKLLVLLRSSVCSYMVYILGLTVLGTVVRELGGLKHFKCPGGNAVTGAWESAGKRARTPEMHR
jgi:hypothetical protein